MSETYTVGLPGDELRSDLRAIYTPGPQPLSVTVQSKVQALFGRSLEEQARTVCAQLSVATLDRAVLLTCHVRAARRVVDTIAAIRDAR